MMSGDAQVIGIKPSLRSFFSSEPLSWAIASSAPSGNSDAIAARAVLAPTAFKKPRRTLSTGNSALTMVASIKLCDTDCSVCTACSPGAWSSPQAQRSIRGRSASKASKRLVMVLPLKKDKPAMQGLGLNLPRPVNGAGRARLLSKRGHAASCQPVPRATPPTWCMAATGVAVLSP